MPPVSVRFIPGIFDCSFFHVIETISKNNGGGGNYGGGTIKTF
jgi:hypothetical protein